MIWIIYIESRGRLHGQLSAKGHWGIMNSRIGTALSGAEGFAARLVDRSQLLTSKGEPCRYLSVTESHSLSSQLVEQLADVRLVALTSSRLGHSPLLHRHAGRGVVRAALACRHSGASMLVATGSAIEPWAERAAELFSVPLLRLAVDGQPRSSEADLVASHKGNHQLHSDGLVIAIADQVDAPYVRLQGRIMGCLLRRLKSLGDATTHVGVTKKKECAGRRLIAAGAVGWYPMMPACASSDKPRKNVKSEDGDALGDAGTNARSPNQFEGQLTFAPAQTEVWTSVRGEWLIHCTRGCTNLWPNETLQQYRDTVLLGDERHADRGPLETLERIIRMRRLLASAITSKQKYPVVCLSELALEELLRQRCYRSHLHRWDYEPYGVALRLNSAKAAGARPVIYGNRANFESISEEDKYRCHPIGTANDWSKEREWRFPRSVSLGKFADCDVRVFARDSAEARDRLRHCPWKVCWLRGLDQA
ncbi:MAG: hypothetical protein ACR2NZ_25570 [Rubripirellula sp.]